MLVSSRLLRCPPSSGAPKLCAAPATPRRPHVRAHAAASTHQGPDEAPTWLKVVLQPLSATCQATSPGPRSRSAPQCSGRRVRTFRRWTCWSASARGWRSATRLGASSGARRRRKERATGAAATRGWPVPTSNRGSSHARVASPHEQQGQQPRAGGQSPRSTRLPQRCSLTGCRSLAAALAAVDGAAVTVQDADLRAVHAAWQQGPFLTPDGQVRAHGSTAGGGGGRPHLMPQRVRAVLRETTCAQAWGGGTRARERTLCRGKLAAAV